MIQKVGSDDEEDEPTFNFFLTQFFFLLLCPLVEYFSIYQICIILLNVLWMYFSKGKIKFLDQISVFLCTTFLNKK